MPELPTGPTPRLSICIPTFNRATLLKVAIDSVLAYASDPGIEIIVGDNASTDATIRLLQEYQQLHPQLRYYRNEVNLGADRNLLKALEVARGDYCWILGSDDAITPDAIAHLMEAMLGEPDLIMAEAIDCNALLQPTGVLQFLGLETCTLDFANKNDVLRYLKSASMHASLFGFLSSMLFKRSALAAIPMNLAYVGSAYPQVSRALDVLVKGRGKLHYLAQPIALNRRDNCAYNSEFGQLLRHLIDLRMFRAVVDDYFSSDLEVRNEFKAFVRKCYSGQIESIAKTGINAVDSFRSFFRHDDAALPSAEWSLRPKVRTALQRLESAGLSSLVFSAPRLLHLGFRGSSEYPNRPLNPRAVGVEIGYSGGYDGTHLPFETQSQDTIWASHCLHKMSDPAGAIKDWLRVARVGGYVVISCTLANAPQGLPPDAFFGVLSSVNSTGSCRVVHCCQTERNTMDGSSQIDLVLQRTRPTAQELTESMSEAMRYHQAGQLDEAERVYRSALLKDPDSFAATHMLGVVHFQRNQLNAAEALLLRALEINDSIPEVHYNLGCVMRSNQRPAEARFRFERSLALNPAFQMAHDRLHEMLQEGL
jgi:abequosyltransferase